jgi:hypothetical protein
MEGKKNIIFLWKEGGIPPQNKKLVSTLISDQ